VSSEFIEIAEFNLAVIWNSPYPWSNGSRILRPGKGILLVSPFTLRLLLAAVLLVPPVFATTVHKAPAARHNSSAAQKNPAKRHNTFTATKAGVKGHPASAARDSAIPRTASSARSRKTRTKKSRGQQSIDPERVTQIQQALIREHYLSGDPNGSWDAQTQAAMQKYQADHGWQTRLIPDARAIKGLGLGPDYSSAINAEGASFSPPPVNATPSAQTAGFAQASGIQQ
jgi:hypothetical protein